MRVSILTRSANDSISLNYGSTYFCLVFVLPRDEIIIGQRFREVMRLKFVGTIFASALFSCSKILVFSKFSL